MTIAQLRQSHPRFFYRSFHWSLKNQDLVLRFEFVIEPDLRFHPSVTLKDVPINRLRHLPKALIDNLVFHLGLMEIPSYWKATCAPEIIIQAGPLSSPQLKFWKKLLLDGLGEFFYKNNIDFTKKDFVRFSVTAPGSALSAFRIQPKQRTLIPMGGGKDSIVTLQLFKEAGEELRPFVYFEPKTRQLDMLKLAGEESPVEAHRTIDPLLLELNREGFLNGHTPITAYLSFLSLLSAVLFDYKWVAFSNERSASEGTTRFHRHSVNHQYSKSFEFEKAFREYVRRFLVKDVEVFSFFRPVYELQIVRLFSQYPEYFSMFLSCNEGYKRVKGKRKAIGQWCGRCSKCLFVFTALSTVVSEQEMKKIFGKDLFEDASLWPIILALVGKTDAKPFECVGTIKENRLALQLNLTRHKEPLPPLLKKFRTLALPRVKPETVIGGLGAQHFLPRRFFSILTKAMRRPLNPLAAWNGQRILILGFGREGRDTLHYLRKHFPNKTLLIADQTPPSRLDKETRWLLKRDANLKSFFGPDYLSQGLEHADVIIKTPGLAPQKLQPFLKPHHQVTSQTQIFFQHCPSTIIGITGSKGKSTTSSMIAHVLKREGWPVALVGNIGQPVLNFLDAARPDDVFVVELSSYQLLSLGQSPHIAVLLNIYPGHLDYHGTLDAYMSAKKHITDFQSPQDHLIYNGTNEGVLKIVKTSKAIKHSFDPNRHHEVKHGLFAASIEPVLEVANLFHIPPKRVLRHLKSFRPLPHRLEPIAKVHGMTFINDSLSTVPEATVAGLRSFNLNVGCLIAGGYDAESDYTSLAPEIIKQKIKTLILFPLTGEKILQALMNFNKQFPAVELPRIHEVTRMKEAVKLAFEGTEPGKVCLLSPGAASYNLFKNYEDRGNQFKKEILAFAKKHSYAITSASF